MKAWMPIIEDRTMTNVVVDLLSSKRIGGMDSLWVEWTPFYLTGGLDQDWGSGNLQKVQHKPEWTAWKMPFEWGE